MASGMGVDENCVSEFSQMKIRKKFNYMIFKIETDKIVIEKTGNGGPKEFISSLPASDCRYGVVDSAAIGKIQFVLWSPDSAPVKSRMMYASSKDALMKKLDGVAGTALESHEKSDLESL